MTKLDDLVALAEATRGPRRLRPCLYADTGAGKSGRAAAVAERLGMPMIRLLLHTSLPEDLWGFPRVVAGKTAWVVPDWAHRAAETPHVILLDELDKPHPDGMAAALTFIWELEVRHVVLHPETVVLAAMQPVDAGAWLAETTTQAVSARLIFVPIRDDWSYVAEKTGIDLSDAPIRELKAPPVYPRPVPRTVEEGVGLARELFARGYQLDAVAERLAGALPADYARVIAERVQGAEVRTGLSVTGVLKAVEAEPTLLERLNLAELSALAPDCIHHLPSRYYRRVLERLCIEGDPEIVRATFEAQYNELARRADEAGGSLEIFGGEDEKKVIEVFLQAFRAIGEEYKSRGEKGKAAAKAAKGKTK